MFRNIVMSPSSTPNNIFNNRHCRRTELQQHRYENIKSRLL